MKVFLLSRKRSIKSHWRLIILLQNSKIKIHLFLNINSWLQLVHCCLKMRNWKVMIVKNWIDLNFFLKRVYYRIFPCWWSVNIVIPRTDIMKWLLVHICSKTLEILQFLCSLYLEFGLKKLEGIYTKNEDPRSQHEFNKKKYFFKERKIFFVCGILNVQSISLFLFFTLTHTNVKIISLC